MIDLIPFGAFLQEKGYRVASGVPCSYLKNFIHYASNELDYIVAANEGEAVAIAAGASLGGGKSMVLLQNSGLPNALAPLTSLTNTFEIPVLVFVSLRGDPAYPDEPQHELLGQITDQLLSVCGLRPQVLSEQIDEAVKQVSEADAYMARERTPACFIVRKGTFGQIDLKEQDLRPAMAPVYFDSGREDANPSRYDVLKRVTERLGDKAAILAATGKTGRELFDIHDAPNHLYMVGSMGCVSSLALGLNRMVEDKPVVAIDGDGALLMRLGSLAANGHYARGRFLHLLLDNGVHDSTGGQKTLSFGVDFPGVARDCGYPAVGCLHSVEELEAALAGWLEKPRPTFLYLKIAPGSRKALGRPNLHPREVRARFQEYLHG